MNVAGKEPHISYCLIPLEYPDLERCHDSSDRPKHQASYLLILSPMEVPGSAVPTFCTSAIWVCLKHLGIVI